MNGDETATAILFDCAQKKKEAQTIKKGKVDSDDETSDVWGERIVFASKPMKGKKKPVPKATSNEAFKTPSPSSGSIPSLILSLIFFRSRTCFFDYSF